MNNQLTDPANHPANSPLAAERIERVIEALESSLAYRNGSTLDHFIADAVKGLRELRESREAEGEPIMYCSAETIAAARDGEHLLRTLSAPSGDCVIPLYIALPAPVVPDTLPCPVFLEPGLKFGKGVRTQCMLDALNRRAEYHAELDAVTPEQRAEHDAGIAEFKAMLGIAPATNDCQCRTCRPVTMNDMRFVVCPDCGNKRCPHANDHNNACTGSNEPGQVGSAYPAAPKEVGSALEMGMARYSGAMQKLADGGD